MGLLYDAYLGLPSLRVRLPLPQSILFGLVKGLGLVPCLELCQHLPVPPALEEPFGLDLVEGATHATVGGKHGENG